MKKIVFVIYLAIGMLISLPIILVLKIFKKQRSIYKYFISWYFPSILKVLNVKVNVKGALNKPLGNTLVISNHLSMMDIVLIVTFIKQPLIFVSKIENKNIPIIGWWMQMTGAVFINRDNIKQSITELNKTTDYMKNDQPVMIFPQGTRSKDIDFKPGSLKFVLKSKGDILPLSIKGTDQIFNTKFYKKSIVNLHINDLVKYEEYKDQNLVEVQRSLENMIKEQVN